jgi:hypothetical protein
VAANGYRTQEKEEGLLQSVERKKALQKMPGAFLAIPQV